MTRAGLGRGGHPGRAVRPRSPIRLLGIAATLIGALACARRPAAAPPPASGLSYEARLGKATFEHYCQTCHGEGGAGDGFNAFNLDPHPRDLSDPAFQKSRTDADLLDAVRRGGGGVGLSPLMPPFGHTLSDRRLNEVVLYLRTLRRPPT